ncbi:MAG: hypothetical protein FJ291_16300 [Planctomycetes bacterium]|nr:hypothetical protein [Planctomycetota bacterium]
MSATTIDVPLLGAKWTIGFFGLFHTAVASLSIGLAAIVTVLQIVGYRRRDRRYDMLARRMQLLHVCIYNIGTIVAIGLIFSLSGLYPQFWSQLFVHFFWTLIVEEFIFFLLAATLTLHYFFWQKMWGHKKLHILLGALLNPLFLLQFYLINGIGGYMLTPGYEAGQADVAGTIMGWDKLGFYNPSFLMLTAHRAFANIAYGGFSVAAICGALHLVSRREKVRQYYEDGGRCAFYTGFLCFISLPIVGYFYAHVLKYDANEAYVNLMWGQGDVVALGIDWWWLKHVFVAAMFGLSLGYFRDSAKRQGATFALPAVLIWSLATFYLMYYMAMGMIMTWSFFFWELAIALASAWLGGHLVRYHQGSARMLFILMGILSFLTVMLGGYVREAARPRFVNRFSHYDYVYPPEQRQPVLMVDKRPEDVFTPEEIAAAKALPKGKLILRSGAEQKFLDPVALIRVNCSGCHTLERVKNYKLTQHWSLIVSQMRAYGLKLTDDEARQIVEHLEAAKPY